MNTFRRAGKALHAKRRKWSDWVDAHARLVVDAGLPATVIASEDTWWYFLDRTYSQAGYLGTDNWFDVGMMSPSQRSACMALIEHWASEHSPELNEDTVCQLRGIFGLHNAGG